MKKKIINFFKSKKSIESNYAYNNFTKFIPLAICGGFFFATIILFAFGPFDWKIENSFKLYSFLILCLIALVIGYVYGINKEIKEKKNTVDVNRVIYVSFGIYITIYMLIVYAIFGKIYPDVITGIYNSGYAYYMSHYMQSDLSVMLTYVGMLTAPFTAFIIPITFLYFKNLKTSAKVLGIITLLSNLFLGIAQGVINSYATFIFQCTLMLTIAFFSDINKKNYKGKTIIVTIIFIMFASFLSYYKITMSNRLIADSQLDKLSNLPRFSDIDEEMLKDMFKQSARFENAEIRDFHILSFLPNRIEASTSHLVSYLTHGYKGLSLAMDEEFTSSYGLGFSDFFRHNILKVFGKVDEEEEYYKRTYMSKIEEYDWNTGEVWSTFFIYPASDIGWFGTVIFVFLIGYVFALSWKDSLKTKNIFANVIFVQMCMMICFFSMNNLLFQSGGTFICMSTMFLGWIVSKIYIKRKQS